MTTPLRTFADVKRRCQPGTRLVMIRHMDPKVPVPFDRLVVRVQSNALELSPWPGKTRNSWLYWGKAADMRIEDPDTFSVLEDGQVIMTYRFAA